MNNRHHIKQLFNRLLDNSISEEEIQELLKYIRTSKSDGEVKKLMDIHWQEIKENFAIPELGEQSDERFSEILRKLDATQKRPETKQVGAARVRKLSLRWIGMAASFLLLVSLGVYWTMKSDANMDMPVTEEVATKSFNGKQVVHLPDGSSVILNAGSQLTYSENFGHDTRDVLFSGEGYFDIAHDPQHPFVVHTGQVKTTVLGTAFNLVAYEDDSDVVVTVERGKVAVGDEQHTYDKILPKEQLVVNKQTRKFEKEEVNLGQVLAWKEKFLILDGVTVAKAADIIGTRHQVQVQISNADMKNCRINAAFMKGESLEQILRVVCAVLQADYTIDGNKVTVTGGRTCK